MNTSINSNKRSSDNVKFATPRNIPETPNSISKKIPSSRISLGIEKRVRDIVSIFPQGDPCDPSKLCFTEQVNRLDKKVYTTTSLATTELSSKPLHINHIGIEESPGNGYEYILAIVDRNTGKPIEFKPASLINFQPRYKPNEELLNGRKRKSLIDYTQDYSMTNDEMRAERNKLTKSFGSAKNNKKLEAHIRRSITNETLDAMSTTAFSSPNTSIASLIKKEENSIIDDGSSNSPTPSNLSFEDDKSKLKEIFEKGSSGMLPKPNYNAKTPSEVYKIEQFLPENYDEFKLEYETESIKYFKLYDSFQSLINSGVSPIIAKKIGMPLRYVNPGIRCTIALKMIILSKFIQHCYRGRKGLSTITSGEFEAFSIPSIISNSFKDEYLGEATGKNLIKYQIIMQKKSKALADLLCLILLFDEPDFILPLSPLVQELGTSENILKNFLTGLGCVINPASEPQALTMNTLRIAKLIGPPVKESSLVESLKKKSSFGRRR